MSRGIIDLVFWEAAECHLVLGKLPRGARSYLMARSHPLCLCVLTNDGGLGDELLANSADKKMPHVSLSVVFL